MLTGWALDTPRYVICETAHLFQIAPEGTSVDVCSDQPHRSLQLVNLEVAPIVNSLRRSLRRCHHAVSEGPDLYTISGGGSMASSDN